MLSERNEANGGTKKTLFSHSEDEPATVQPRISNICDNGFLTLRQGGGRQRR